MAQVDLGKFSCSACNRQYPWKPEYAGRKVKCKCGQVLTAPTDPPKAAAAEPEDDDLLGGLYDLAEQEQQAARTGATVETGLRCPSCQGDMLPGETVCPACGFNLKTGLKQRTQKATAATGAPSGGGAAAPKAGNPMLAYAGMAKRSAAQAKADNANAIGGSELKELYIPGALVFVGFLLTVLQHGYAGGAWRGLTYALPVLSLSVLFNLVLSFIGIVIVAKLIDLGFGAPGPAITKLVAICLLGPAIANLVGSVVGADSGFVRHMVPALITLPISAGLFMYLFNLDLDESIFTGVVIYLVNHWAVMVLVALLLSGVASPFGGSGGGGAGGKNPTAAVVEADEAAAEAIDRPNATEAREWLKDNANRMYSGESHFSSQKFVDDLYAAGAKNVVTLSSSGEGYALIIDLPTKDEPRKKVLEIIKAKEVERGFSPKQTVTDEGQRYHTFEFSLGSL